MNSSTKVVVSAADLVRGFPQWREQARQDPVVISNHGRETHVLVGIELWEQLRAAATQALPASASAGANPVFDFAAWMDDAVIVCDDALNILFANRVAHAVCHKSTGSLDGRSLLLALPEVAGTLLDLHLRRTMTSGEPSEADSPSPFAAGAWLRIHIFPLEQRYVIAFRDISEEVQRHRMADVKAVLLDTMGLHGGIGYLRVSLRGTIDVVEGSFAAMLGLPAERLQGVPLLDLAEKSARPALRRAIDEALDRGAPSRVTTGFITNDGDVRDLVVAISPLKGAYGGEGAICLMTPA